MAGPASFRGTFRDDLEARAVYSEAAGVARIMPRAVAVPEDADDVATLMRWAAESGTALVPRGAGSSMAGGAVGPGVIVDLGRLRAGPDIDAQANRARVGAATTRDALADAAAANGLAFPVDPSSGAFATLGGMCATNAAGARTVRYGAMRRWVDGVECVFDDGTRAWLRRGERRPSVPALDRFEHDVAPRVRAADARVLRHDGVRKESSGYALGAWRESGDVVDLIVGSEGTLAIVTALELRLAPRPAATTGALAAFASLDAATVAAAELAALGVSAVELLDRTFLEVAAEHSHGTGLPAATEVVLLIETEGAAKDDATALAQLALDRCHATGATRVQLALSPDEERRLWALRHAASPILNRLAPRLQSMQLIEDGCVPLTRFAEYVRGVRAALDAVGFRGVIFGHAGDGHAHVNALVDLSMADWRERSARLVDEVTALVARLGGTLAGEHGDGRLRTPLLPQVWPREALELFAATKRAFDPRGILNPGVKVAREPARSLADIKYDASLPALPTAARNALDLVVREKAWGRHRLDLL